MSTQCGWLHRYGDIALNGKANADLANFGEIADIFRKIYE
jgi:hypothetical protein